MSNQRKGGATLEPSPALTLHLSVARMHARIARGIAQQVDKDRKKAPLLAKLEKAITAGEITEEEILELFTGLPRIIRKAYDVPDIRISLMPGLEIVERQGRGDITIYKPE